MCEIIFVEHVMVIPKSYWIVVENYFHLCFHLSEVIYELSHLQYSVLLMLCRILQKSSVLRCLELMRTKRFVRSSCSRRTTLLSRASTFSQLSQLIRGLETRCRSLSSWLSRSPPTHRRLLLGQYLNFRAWCPLTCAADSKLWQKCGLCTPNFTSYPFSPFISVRIIYQCYLCLQQILTY